MSADEPTMSVEKPTNRPGESTMSADEPSPPSPTRGTTMSPDDQHTQMLDPSRSQPPKSPQAAPSAPTHARASVGDGLAVKLEQLRAFYGNVAQVKGIDLDFHANEVTAIIGPSGCGKSTMVRCINRMHEEVPGARAEGKVLLDGFDIYDSSVDVVAVRRAIGMVFQKPNPFPTMSVFDNVAAGLRLASRGRGNLHNKVETALRGAGLWEEVKDRLSEAGAGLSGGQQQRLCIARSLAVEPEVILMDEPCSALDPIATLKIEELIDQLKSKVTIVIVTHNMQQAARVADRTAFMLSGELVEVGQTQQIFTNPHDSRTEEYVTGKFG
ncbi:MAG TPA: phosphate ABC transporter ATP-binding protein PstB [Solirubrobacteraceae bacterium]|nr:phosphate ABC transporter ATP-binding protein PstB [Solirubrobacteraceae bacterium]